MKLFDAVAFDAPTASADGQGGQENGWTEAHVCRADIMYLRGGETVIAGRLAGQQPVVVTIRRCAAALAVTPDYRMRDTRRGDDYNIRSIVPAKNRLYLELTCEKGVAV